MNTYRVDPVSRDLVVRAGDLVSIGGKERLEQDLRFAILQPLGGDPYQLNLGSNLDYLLGSSYDEVQIESLIREEIIDAIRRFQTANLTNLRYAQVSDIDSLGTLMLANANMADYTIRTIDTVVVTMVSQTRAEVRVAVTSYSDVKSNVDDLTLEI